jgi:NADP-dependent 3-hydroxy acid dehydrogenase YdfG
MDKEIVLLTGASSGIGRAVALKLAEAHHTVVLTARRGDILAKVARELTPSARGVMAIPADATAEDDVRRVVEDSLRAFGTIHALVHCAGWGTVKPLQEMTAEEWRRTLDTNLTSLFYFAKYLLPHFLRRRHGHLVALSSIAGREPFPNHTAYCASKFGLMGLLGALRKEVRGTGVTITAVCPGATDTPYWDDIPGDWPREKMMDAETVADAVLFALGQPESACLEELVLQPAGGAL